MRCSRDGGRLLGLCSPGSDENFYWTHTALNSVETAEEFYAGDQWHNSGGDRTWLAPEADLFFPNLPKLDKYFQQRSLDPGRYRVVATRGGFKLVNRLTVTLSRSSKKLNLMITKSFTLAPSPLRHEKQLKLGPVEYVGYTQHTSLKLLGASRRTRDHVGLWNLIQMPHGGDLLMPIFGRARPRHIFSTVGTIPPEDLITTEHLIRYRMRQKGEHKISMQFPKSRKTDRGRDKGSGLASISIIIRHFSTIFPYPKGGEIYQVYRYSRNTNLVKEINNGQHKVL